MTASAPSSPSSPTGPAAARNRPQARALVVRTAGTNCDAEMCRAFELAGAAVQLIHLDRLIAEPTLLDGFELFGFPGGFSYGDDIASGRIFAVRLKEHLWPKLRAAASRGSVMIAACNGFQVIVQAGLLPGAQGGNWPAQPPAQEVTLQHNIGGRFIDTWLPVSYDPASVCVWTKGLTEAFAADERTDVLQLPIAHGEGRFVTAGPEVLARLRQSGQVAVRYTDNVNGSEDAIAGICDPSGRIFGLMPHPERYLDWTRHPYWTRLSRTVRAKETPGLLMFRSAVAAAVAAR